MTMREKLARAIYDSHRHSKDGWISPIVWDNLHCVDREWFLDFADAALDALMKPTDGMKSAAMWSINDGETEAFDYYIAIRAAKDGK